MDDSMSDVPSFHMSDDESDDFAPTVKAKTKTTVKKTAAAKAKESKAKATKEPKAPKAPKAKVTKTTKTVQTTLNMAPKKRARAGSDDEDQQSENDSSNDASQLSNTPPNAKKQKKAPAAKKQTAEALSDIENESILETEPKPKKTKTSTEQYQKLTQLEHILKRPDTYIGSVEKTDTTMWVFNSENKEMELRKVTFVPGLYKIFDEIMVNAADNKQNDPNMKNIKVVVDREKGEISVENDGRGIPVEIHEKEKIYIPEMIFGHLLTGSNYDDDEAKTTGGRNGYGAKLCNIFSTEFTLETQDSKSGKRYKQTWTDNMSKMGKARISSSKNADFTRVTFTPDWTKFRMNGIDDDFEAMVKRRVYDMAGTVKGVKRANTVIVEDSKGHPKWEVGFAVSDGAFQQVSFVNSIATTSGGTHVNYIADQICEKLLEVVKKRNPKGAALKSNQVRNHIFLFVNCLITNPAFTSQTKEQLTTRKQQFGSKCVLTDDFLKKIGKTEAVENILNFAAKKADQELAKSDGNRRSRMNNPKLVDANLAGTKRGHECTLILTEGDSAKGLAVAGRAVLDPDRIGVFPLRGKLLNVRDASHDQIAKNAEIQNIKQFLGLKHKTVYKDTLSLRYGHLMIMADQDHDGSHIKGLLINFLQVQYPSLLKLPEFFREFITPIVKVWKGPNPNKPANLRSFFTMPEYEEWKETHGSDKSWKHKYYKGLGTSKPEDAQNIFQQSRCSSEGVVELAGYVSQVSAYHHGEASMQMTIVGLAQNFVGSNNVNCLEPSGNFDFRPSPDESSPSLMTQSWNYNVDDGRSIEPVTYFPVVPMVLINGADGIGTGWSTNIPNYHPVEVGTPEPAGPDRYKFNGIIRETGDTEVEITELPIRMWTDDFKARLEEIIKAEKVPSFIKDYKEFNDHKNKVFAEKFKLNKTVATSNLVAFDHRGQIRKYDRVEDILEEFYEQRLKMYTVRKAHWMKKLNVEYRKLTNQARFVTEIIENKLIVSKKKKPILVAELRKRGYEGFPKITDAKKAGETDDVVENDEEVAADEDAGARDYDYLLGLPIWSLTQERVEKLNKQMYDKKDEIDTLDRLSEKDLWCEDLDAFVAEWEDQLKQDAEIAKTIRNTNRRRSNKIGAGGKVGGKGRTRNDDEEFTRAAAAAPKKWIVDDDDDDDDESDDDNLLGDIDNMVKGIGGGDKPDQWDRPSSGTGLPKSKFKPGKVADLSEDETNYEMLARSSPQKAPAKNEVDDFLSSDNDIIPIVSKKAPAQKAKATKEAPKPKKAPATKSTSAAESKHAPQSPAAKAYATKQNRIKEIAKSINYNDDSEDEDTEEASPPSTKPTTKGRQASSNTTATKYVISDDSDEDIEMEDAAPPRKATKGKNASKKTYVSDDEDESIAPPPKRGAKSKAAPKKLVVSDDEDDSIAPPPKRAPKAKAAPKKSVISDDEDESIAPPPKRAATSKAAPKKTIISDDEDEEDDDLGSSPPKPVARGGRPARAAAAVKPKKPVYTIDSDDSDDDEVDDVDESALVEDDESEDDFSE
ncbi:hypothetical protein DID88_000107 [Monilinia fructigena]|uniref:DNA topoisomerase 2 n=1 Tax=Monilinia fructigena TaxID=38457 RepID=A0A395IJH0_9HELO|nr:hypothetical protein DID88_000107 [Monilinia fructigena]